MTIQLGVFGALGVLTTAWAVWANRRLFTGGTVGRPSPLESVFYVVGVASLCIGWYCNVRYTHHATDASYWSYTRALFDNWAAASAAQDYTIVNLVLLPLWTIVDGRRRGIALPWIFFVMSLFTSLAFSMALYLAFVERQVRYTAATGDGGTSSATPTADQTAAATGTTSGS
jgi:hypothetical protein